MMSQRPQFSSSVKYERIPLNTATSNDGFTASQFEQKMPTKVPYKAILMATVLFFGGTLLIIIGSLLLSGHIDVKYADRTWPVLLLGLLMFIPGVYHVRIAVYAWKGYAGYSYDDIPDFD